MNSTKARRRVAALLALSTGLTGGVAFALEQVESTTNERIGVDTQLTSRVNQPPSASIHHPGSIIYDEGDEIILDGSRSSDPDGDGLTYLWEPSEWFEPHDRNQATFTLSEDDFSGPVSLTVDDGWATDKHLRWVEVRNVAPSLYVYGVDGEITYPEGAEAYLGGVLDDPGHDELELDVDWGDGTSFTQARQREGVTLIGRHIYRQQGAYDVDVTLTDDDGGVSTDAVVARITNVAPTVDAVGLGVAVEGQEAELVVEFSDPGLADEHRVSVVWGDGRNSNVDLPVGARSATLTHAWAEEGSYDVRVAVFDETGDKGELTSTFEVVNAAPEVSVESDALSIGEGGQVNFTGTFSDTGTYDDHFLTIYWNDGRPNTGYLLGSGPDGTGNFVASMPYGDSGAYHPRFCVTDDDGAQGCTTVTVIVRNDAPIITLDTPSSLAFPGGGTTMVSSGTASRFTATVADPGSDDLTVDWSTGKQETFFNNGTDADAPNSPGGTYPFQVATTATVQMVDGPAVHDLLLTARDDEGSTDAVAHQVVATDVVACTYDRAEWDLAFRRQSKPLFGIDLYAYTDVVAAITRQFADVDDPEVLGPLLAERTGDDAYDLLGMLEQQVLVLNLNVVSGAQHPTAWLDTDGDGSEDATALRLLKDAQKLFESPESPDDSEVNALIDRITSVNATNGDCAEIQDA